MITGLGASLAPRPRCGWLTEPGFQCDRTADRPPVDHDTRPPIHLCGQHWESWDRWWAWTPVRGAEKQAQEVTLTVARLEQQRVTAERRLGVLRIELDALREQSDILQDRFPRAPKGRIYVLRRQDGMIKIGWTRNFRDRMWRHQRDHGHLKLLALFNGSVQDEHALHRRFAGYLAEGREWFEPGAEITEWLASLKTA